MAYTYDDFLKAAGTSGVMDRFSQDDLTVAQRNPEYGLSMVSLMKDVSGAKTPEQRLLATETANQLRKNYGVYGSGSTYASSHGSQIQDLMDQVNNYGSFNYGNQNAYQQLLDSVANQQPFRYEASEDPTYGSYKKAYLREGDRAAANALAQASAASGGQASSYAVQAAQQANNYYAGQLADIIPTLLQNAYQQYQNDFSQKLSQLGALESDRAQAQEDWINQYNMLQNALTNLQNQDATDYQRYLENIDNAMALYQLLGYATPEVAEILGIGASTGTGSEYTGSNYTGDSGDGDAGEGTTVEPVVDMRSVNDLGYGSISEDRLSDLIAAGEVEMYQEGNMLKFKKATGTSDYKTGIYDFTQGLKQQAQTNTTGSNRGASSGSGADTSGNTQKTEAQKALELLTRKRLLGL